MQAISLLSAIGYTDGAVVSKTLLDKPAGTLTLFAFDAGQGLSEHTSPYDAVVQVLEGSVEIWLAGNPQIVKAGEMLVMPANVPHALKAVERFKMLLILVR